MKKNKKLKMIYLAIPFGIAVTTCCIVNYALDQRLTWSLLVAGSCIFAYALLSVLLFGGKHRIILSYGITCILIVPFLYLIEGAANVMVKEPYYWVSGLGIPICVIWLAVCAVLILIRKFLHVNAWMMAGFFVLAFYIGERFTNSTIDDFTGIYESWRLSEHYPVIYFGAAAALFLIGIITAAIRYVRRKERPAGE